MIRMVYISSRPRDGFRPLHPRKGKEKDEEARLFSWAEFFLINTQPQPPSPRKTGFPPPLPDITAYKLGFLHLTSNSVCKQEAAEVGGCETGKPEDSSENAALEQELDLARGLNCREFQPQPVHPLVMQIKLPVQSS